VEILIENIGNEQDNYLNSLTKGNEVWCCERNLGESLKILFPNEEIIHNKQLIISDKKMRPDYRIPSKNLLIEFNGYHHFTNTKTIINDYKKKALILESGLNLIEIPYFVQLTENVTEYLFSEFTKSGYIQDFSNGFPHGFIHPKAGMICDFCYLGLQRVIKIFREFPGEVKEGCFESIRVRSKVDGVPEAIYNPLLILKEE